MELWSLLARTPANSFLPRGPYRTRKVSGPSGRAPNCRRRPLAAGHSRAGTCPNGEAYAGADGAEL